MPKPTKPILCIDFDGVLHSYTSGWQGASQIPDPPVPGAVEFLLEARQKFTVAIFSSRSHQWGGKRAMKRWLKRHLLEWLEHSARHKEMAPTFRLAGFEWSGIEPFEVEASDWADDIIQEISWHGSSRPPWSRSTTGRSSSLAPGPPRKNSEISNPGTSANPRPKTT